MKCNWTTCSLLLIALLLMSFQQPNAAHRSFEKFITQENKMNFGADTAYYLVIEPKMCASCNIQAVRTLTAYAQRQPLYIFCDSSKREELASYVRHRNVKYVTHFNYAWVSKQLFMRSGVAFGLGNHGQLSYVDMINGTTLKKYQ